MVSCRAASWWRRTKSRGRAGSSPRRGSRASCAMSEPARGRLDDPAANGLSVGPWLGGRLMLAQPLQGPSGRLGRGPAGRRRRPRRWPPRRCRRRGRGGRPRARRAKRALRRRPDRDRRRTGRTGHGERGAERTFGAGEGRRRGRSRPLRAAGGRPRRRGCGPRGHQPPVLRGGDGARPRRTRRGRARMSMRAAGASRRSSPGCGPALRCWRPADAWP